MGLLQVLQYKQAQSRLHLCLPDFKGVSLQALRLWKPRSNSMILSSTAASVSTNATYCCCLFICAVYTAAHDIVTPCCHAGTASQQQKHQSKTALHQFLSDGSSGKPALPRLQAATQNLDNTSMLGCQMKTSAAQRMSSHAHHCTASAVHSIQRPRESHLAALKAHGDLDSVLQSAACKQHWPAQQRLHRALTKSVANAGQTALKHKSKPVRDMFGVAADDSGTGADLGLVLLRPASRLW